MYIQAISQFGEAIQDHSTLEKQTTQQASFIQVLVHLSHCTEERVKGFKTLVDGRTTLVSRHQDKRKVAPTSM